VDPVWYNLVRTQWDTVLILTSVIQSGAVKYEHSRQTVLILMNVIQHGATRYDYGRQTVLVLIDVEHHASFPS
jgi:hypothetical protein